MARLPFLYVLSFLSTCAYSAAQIPRPSLACMGTVLGKVPVGLTLIQDPSVVQDPNSGTVLIPGVPLRILQSVGGGDPNGFPNIPFIAGPYPGTLHCSLNSGAIAATFDIPIVLTVLTGGTAYSVSLSSFTGTFNLGAPGTLTLTLPGGSTGPRPILFTSFEILNANGALLLTPIAAATPLPPSIILTLTGLAGAGLLAARRKRYFI
ncbi:MAG TPA: hypothetical protein VIX89_12840 [Bryobacteraceae bacterium]